MCARSRWDSNGVYGVERVLLPLCERGLQGRSRYIFARSRWDTYGVYGVERLLLTWGDTGLQGRGRCIYARSNGVKGLLLTWGDKGLQGSGGRRVGCGGRGCSGIYTSSRRGDSLVNVLLMTCCGVNEGRKGQCMYFRSRCYSLVERGECRVDGLLRTWCDDGLRGRGSCIFYNRSR